MRTAGTGRSALLVAATIASALFAPGARAGEGPDPDDRTVGPKERAARQFERTYPFVDSAIRVGERLVFSVRYGPIHAGTATIAVDSIAVVAGDSCFHVASTAASNDFFSTFFYVRDRVESCIGINDLRPRRFAKYLLEGNYSNEQTIEFDARNNLAIYNDGGIFEVLSGTHDVLSAFFDVRSRRLDVGDEILLECHADRKNYPLTTQVLRREQVEVPAGKFDCLVVEPVLRTPGLFKHEGSLAIWLTDDARKIPVKMSTSLPIGSISVVLTEISGRGDQ